MGHYSSEDLSFFANTSAYPSQTCLDIVIEGDELESSSDSTEGQANGMNYQADPGRTMNRVEVERDTNGLVRR
jgi:hypothetical protein